MFIHSWKREVFTIPNILSLLRIALIPVYIVVYQNAAAPKDYLIAGSILAVSCLTDLIDGKIARQFNMVSTIGKVLDPIADKLTQFALTWCLSIKYPAMRCVLSLLVIKESFQAAMVIIFFRKGKVLSGALISGKICTTVLFFSLIALVLTPNLDYAFIEFIAAVDTFFLYFAFAQYFFAYFGKNPKLEKFRD